MRTFSKTDTGKARNTNQDFVFCEENAIGKFPNLFIVADGMGGHNAGDTASRICVERFLETVKSSDKVTTVGVLEEAVAHANLSVYQMANEDSRLEGMGTTLVSCVVLDDTAYVINVGDSRLYLLSDSISQITEDHSLVEEMVKSGEIRRDEMRTHPNKNIITRALGTKEDVKADCFEIKVKPGDVLLLCSDGLCNMLEDETMESIIKNEPDVVKAGNLLVDRANELGGKDNISVILVQI